MEFLKKYWWVILEIILLIVAYWFFFMRKSTTSETKSGSCTTTMDQWNAKMQEARDMIDSNPEWKEVVQKQVTDGRYDDYEEALEDNADFWLRKAESGPKICKPSGA